MSWINIARVGRFEDMAGREVDITSELLSAIARNYDPARHPAPLVFGHPTLNGSAFCWVEGLRVVGSVLQAKRARSSRSFRPPRAVRRLQ